MHKTYNLVELFSGIGSQVKALKNLGIKVNTLGTSEWDVHAIAAYDVIHNSPEIPAEVESMSKEQLLGILSNYTFSNSGKEPLDYNSFKTYSAEALRRIYISILRNKNFVDISCLDGKLLPDDIDILTYSFPCQDLSNVGAFHGYKSAVAGWQNPHRNESCRKASSAVSSDGKCSHPAFKKTFQKFLDLDF